MPEHTFNPTQDCFMYKAVPYTTYGTSAVLELYDYSTNWWIRTLMKFVLNGVIGPYDTINSALLRLYYWDYQQGKPPDREITAVRVLEKDWVEAEVCWAYKKGTTEWSEWGAPFTLDDSVILDLGTANPPRWLEWDITEMIRTVMAEDGGIADVMVKLPENGVAVICLPLFRSIQYANSAYWPQLVVDYTEGEAPPPPPPGKKGPVPRVQRIKVTERLPVLGALSATERLGLIVTGDLSVDFSAGLDLEGSLSAPVSQRLAVQRLKNTLVLRKAIMSFMEK